MANEQVVLVDDQVFVKKNVVKSGESLKLSSLFHNLSEVLEVNMPLLRIKNLASGSIQWRHHNQLKKRNVRRVAAKDQDLRVRFKGITTGSKEADTHNRTDRQHTLGHDTSLEGTSAADDFDYTPDCNDEYQHPPANYTHSNNNHSYPNLRENEHDNGPGGSNNAISDAEGWEIAGERMANDNTMNDITPFSVDPAVPDQANSDGATSGPATPDHAGSVPATADPETSDDEGLRSAAQGSASEASTSGRPRGRPPGPSRKATRTQQLLRNLRPRIDRNAPTTTGGDMGEQADASTSGDIYFGST